MKCDCLDTDVGENKSHLTPSCRVRSIQIDSSAKNVFWAAATLRVMRSASVWDGPPPTEEG